MSFFRIAVILSLALSSAVAQSPQPSFTTREDVHARADTLTLGDLNNDGIVDLIEGVPVTVLLGKGDGTFGTPVAYDIKASPFVLADMNGDGKLDLVFGLNTGSIGVVLGNGDGTFQNTHAEYALPALTLPIALAIGDFNGDGRPDVAVGTASAGLFIYINQHKGEDTLTLADAYFPGRFVGAITAADIDGDSKPDLAVGEGAHTTFLMGIGKASFQTGQTFSNAYRPGSILFADFNNDGIADMAVGAGFWEGYFFEAYLYFGKGGGNFAPPQVLPFPGGVGQIEAGDINRDGFLDLVTLQATPDQIGLLFNNGDGTFRSGGHFSVCGAAAAFALAPLRVLGVLDIVALSSLSYETSVLLNAGNGTYPDGLKIHLPGQPGPLVAGDFTRDGLDDLAVTTTANVQIFLNSGKLGHFFTAGQSIALQPTQTIGGDFNADGIPDLAMAISGNQIAVVLGRGDGTFSPPLITPSGGIPPNNLPIQIFAGDFNGDGKLDLITTFNGLLFGNGDETFQPPKAFMSPAIMKNVGYPSAIAVADLNGDGKTDFALLGNVPGLYSFLNVGQGLFRVSGRAAGSGNLQQATQAVVGDVNNDGIPDIAVATNGFGVTVFFGSGDGSFLPLPYSSLSTSLLGSYGIVAGDFNSDGLEDMAVAGYYPQSDAIIFTSNGDQTFQPPIYFGTAPNSDYIVKGHFNKFRPGRRDLALSTLDGVDILLNTTK